MAYFRVARPKISDEQREEITKYLCRHWRSAVDARNTQVMDKYAQWEKVYEARPTLPERRSPWRGASNIVVPLARIFVDTFVARTQNIVFATRPLFNVEGFATGQRDAVKGFLNTRALAAWRHYTIFGRMLLEGSTQGTTLVKTRWHSDTQPVYSVSGDDSVETRQVTTYCGPQSNTISFDDFYVYPVTARDLQEAEIIFHAYRVTPERLREVSSDSAQFRLSEDDIEAGLKRLTDTVRITEMSNAGVVDGDLVQVTLVEIHFKYNLAGQSHRFIGVYSPLLDKLVDLYHNPIHPAVAQFHHYAPWPRKHLFYGYSACEMLDQFQNEISTIHNNRRDNAALANMVMWKRKSGTLIPNPADEVYPGKVWDLDDISDLDVLSAGRNLAGDLIPEEEYTFSLAERLFGIGAIQQGMSSGQMGKRGVYNTQGTLGVMAEGNQRQDTNIRLAREVLGDIGRSSFLMCAQYGQIYGTESDFNLRDLPESQRQLVVSAFGSAFENDMLRFDVAASNAGANSEVAKASLYQLAQVMGQYGTTIQQLAAALMNQQMHPGLRELAGQMTRMYQWVARRLLNAYNEYEGVEFLPDVTRLAQQFAGYQPQGDSASPVSGPVDPGGTPPTSGNDQLAGLEALLSAPTALPPQ